MPTKELQHHSPPKEESHKGPTATRRWRPSPLYIVAAALAIVLILSWFLFLVPGSARVVDPNAPRTTQPGAPVR